FLAGRHLFRSMMALADYRIVFFQAEDGIRDRNVTGVQTCALPIYSAKNSRPSSFDRSPPAFFSSSFRSAAAIRTASPVISVCLRSEERRVGKECSSCGATG